MPVPVLVTPQYSLELSRRRRDAQAGVLQTRYQLNGWVVAASACVLKISRPSNSDCWKQPGGQLDMSMVNV